MARLVASTLRSLLGDQHFTALTWIALLTKRAIRMTAVRDFLARDLVVTLAGRYHIWPA